MREGRASDLVVSALVLSGAALASYISGLLPAIIAVFGVELRWFPIKMLGPGTACWVGFITWTLPAIALALFLTAMVARTCRTSLLGVLSSDYGAGCP